MQADAYLTPSLHAVHAEYLARFSEEALLFCERSEETETDTTQAPELFVLGANTAFQRLIQPIEVGRSLTQAWPQLWEALPALNTLQHELAEGEQHQFNTCWFANPARLLTITVSRISTRHLVLSVKNESESVHLMNKLETLQKELDRCRMDAARNQALLTDNMERYLQAVASKQRECLEVTEGLLPPEGDACQLVLSTLYEISTHIIRFSMAHRLDFRRTLVDLPVLIAQVIEKFHREAPRLSLEPRGIMQIMAAVEPMEAMIHNITQAILHNTPDDQMLTLICGLNESFVDTHFYLTVQAAEPATLQTLQARLSEGDLEFQLARHLAQLQGGDLTVTQNGHGHELKFEIFLNQD